MRHDISALENKLQNLDQSLARLSDGKHAQQLIAIIHRPGWTTLAEEQLVHSMLDHLQRQMDSLHDACESLLAAANKVGGEQK